MATMPLHPWAELITREVRTRLPDSRPVRAMRVGTTVTWTFGQRSATLEARDSGIWWLVASSRTYCENPDADAAHVAASNILVHFDSRWCRGIDHEPYSEVEIKRIGGEPRPLRSTFGA